MSKCINCGNELPQGEKICSLCGTAQPNATSKYNLVGEQTTGDAGNSDLPAGFYDRTKAPGHPIDQPPMYGNDGMNGGMNAGMGGMNAGMGGMNPGMNNGMNGGQGYPPAYGSQGGYVEPPRVQNKNGALIAILLVLFCAIGVGAFFILNNFMSSPKGVAKKFVAAFEELDVDALAELFPPELSPEDEVAQIRTQFDTYKSYGAKIKFNNVKYDVGSPYSKSMIRAVEQQLKASNYNCEGKLDVMKDVTISATLHVEAAGESQDQKIKWRLLCAKYKGKWKIIGLYL
jgi:hypothetical protein